MELRLRHLWRTLGLDHNPVRRPIDRLEARFRLLLAVAVVAGGPILGVTFAARTHTELTAQAAVEQADFRQVTAVIAGHPEAAGGLGADGSHEWRAVAVVSRPDGRDQRVRIPVSSGAAPGDRVRIWMNGRAQVVRQPVSAFDAHFSAAMIAILTPALLAGVAWTLAITVQAVVVRATGPAWDRAWWQIDPSRPPGPEAGRDA